MQWIYLALVIVCLREAYGHSSFRERIPNGNRVPHPCRPGRRPQDIWTAVGHMEPNYIQQKNAFGLSLQQYGVRWTVTICQMDSDGDGLTNGQELGDPDCTWNGQPGTESGPAIGHPGLCEPDRQTCDSGFEICGTVRRGGGGGGGGQGGGGGGAGGQGMRTLPPGSSDHPQTTFSKNLAGGSGSQSQSGFVEIDGQQFREPFPQGQSGGQTGGGFSGPSRTGGGQSGWGSSRGREMTPNMDSLNLNLDQRFIQGGGRGGMSAGGMGGMGPGGMGGMGAGGMGGMGAGGMGGMGAGGMGGMSPGGMGGGMRPGGMGGMGAGGMGGMGAGGMGGMGAGGMGAGGMGGMGGMGAGGMGGMGAGGMGAGGMGGMGAGGMGGMGPGGMGGMGTGGMGGGRFGGMGFSGFGGGGGMGRMPGPVGGGMDWMGGRARGGMGTGGAGGMMRGGGMGGGRFGMFRR